MPVVFLLILSISRISVRALQVEKALVNDINRALEEHGLKFRVFSLVCCYLRSFISSN